ncbi:MAG: hypothetical protein AAF532_03650 [Planctomycetota bacterium]
MKTNRRVGVMRRRGGLLRAGVDDLAARVRFDPDRVDRHVCFSVGQTIPVEHRLAVILLQDALIKSTWWMPLAERLAARCGADVYRDVVSKVADTLVNRERARRATPAGVLNRGTA